MLLTGDLLDHMSRAALEPLATRASGRSSKVEDRLCLHRRAGETRGEVVSGPHDCDGNPRALQPKQQRLPAPARSVEAGGIDVDERDPAP